MPTVLIVYREIVSSRRLNINMSIHFLKEVFLEYFNIENRNFKTHENLYINISLDDCFNPNVSSFIFCAWLCKDLSYNYCAYWEKTFMLRRRELTISLYTIKTRKFRPFRNTSFVILFSLEF
jgi:hypothetical protein